ncbi:MAG: hypothetical protein E6G56_01850 [Actinobacteria bacterium]|nr:MAG: hypothetical protein E6G56_01850 [Actinomycetota bacterium]
MAALVASAAFILLVPSGSGGASLARVRSQLRALHLRPAPLFPARLPASFRGAGATLNNAGFDFNVDWDRSRPGRGGSRETVFLVSFRRAGPQVLGQVLHDRRTTSSRRVRVGARTVYVIHSSKLILGWGEQGRTYLLISKYLRPSTADLKRFVRALRPLH